MWIKFEALSKALDITMQGNGTSPAINSTTVMKFYCLSFVKVIPEKCWFNITMAQAAVCGVGAGVDGGADVAMTQ